MVFNRDNSILKLANNHLLKLGAQVSEIGPNDDENSDFTQISCNYNGHEFTIETDYSDDCSTTLSFVLDIIPNRAIDFDDPINAVINRLVVDLKRTIPPPAMVQRTYGFTGSETQGITPDWPEREPVGTSILISFLLGWEDIRASEFSKWTKLENDPLSGYVGLVRNDSSELLEVGHIIDNALQFIGTAKVLLGS
jgi:hypothetical protein